MIKYGYVCILFVVLGDEGMDLQNNAHYCEEVLVTASFFSAVREIDVSLVSRFSLPW